MCTAFAQGNLGRAIMLANSEHFNEIREVPEGFINVIQIQAGLPVSFEIEESISSI